MASDSPATLKLYYWPINFRGHFIQALLRYAGVNYELAPVSELLQLKNAEPAASNPAIFMAPPLLQDGNDFFSQTPAILGYLGAKTGLAPSDLRLATVCNVVVGNCGDIINELTLQCGMKRWDTIDVTEFEKFITGRFVRWCKIMEAAAVKEGLTADSKYYLGTDSVTYADTTVFATFATMAKCLPLIEPVLRANMPCVMALVDRLGANAGLKALLEETDPNRYCGGLIEKSIRGVIAASSLAAKQ